MLSLDDVDRMTRQFGDGWGYPHVCRVLKLIELIREDLPHDREVLTWATHLHDWGAFPRYRQAGVPHALRSRQIAQTEILPQSHFTVEQKAVLLEAIDRHDYNDWRPVESTEALLLREADWLDMLGVIGVIREFAWGPNDLRLCYDRLVKHRETLKQRFTLPVAARIAAERISQMDMVLNQILMESFDLL